MKFSIICLTYRRRNLLEEAMYSVLQQTHSDFELLIINDNSSQKLLFDHPKVRIYNLEHKIKTLGDKRNFGVSQSTGDLILQLDDDDLIFPKYLENLARLIGDADYLHPQRPIFYFNDPNKIFLSPHPIANTFLYRKDTVGDVYHYDSVNFDEITPFYLKVKRVPILTHRFALLSPADCGYIYRQDIDNDKKYAMGQFKTEKIFEQDNLLSKIKDVNGVITLNPRWNKDYISIINTNCKFSVRQTYSPIEEAIQKDQETWKNIKVSWHNALKFIESANSRGILSTVANVLSISKEGGERVSAEIYAQRKTSCFGNKTLKIDPCKNFRYVDGKGAFCSSCGCGTNKLAQLDGDGYTKLHYPQLECPLKKKGFSNYSNGSILSIIITCCNESEFFLNRTINSIRKTAGYDPEIIIVDDASTIPIKNKERVIRNDTRIGVGRSRHKGATFASNPYVLFTDGHMIFDAGWYDNFVERSKSASPTDVFCGTCLGLNEKDLDLSTHRGAYHGARLELYNEKENQILEGKWIPEKKDSEYELSCLMGALYFFNKDFFFKIRGLSDIKMWGSDEPLLSLKTLLCGGRIFILKNVRAGHVFRNSAPYVTDNSYLIYNKIRMAKTLLPDELATTLINKIPKDGNFAAAMAMINSEEDIILEHKQYYKSIFTRDFNDILTNFNIQAP